MMQDFFIERSLETKERIVREHYDSANYKDSNGKKLKLGKLTPEQINDLYKSLVKLRATDQYYRDRLRDANARR